MRRKEKQVSNEQALEWLKNGSSGVLSLVDPSGKPYCVPVSYIYHVGAVWFHCAKEGKKLDCIAHCDDVCFCVFNDHEPLSEKYSIRYDSVIVSGKASVVRFTPMVEEILFEICKKYTKNSDEAIADYIKAGIDRVCVVRVSLDDVSGKQSPAPVR